MALQEFQTVVTIIDVMFSLWVYNSNEKVAFLSPSCNCVRCDIHVTGGATWDDGS